MSRYLAPLIGRAGVQSEDCLYVNVWTPKSDRRLRPVLVWIHGGAFVIGTGATSLYAGGRMARGGDVVVVTINYRLGALGFLNLRGVEDCVDANLGLRDQVAALEWVRDNIEQFGGDPENVTIFGESAGGMSVSTLLGTPSARGLFHRAVAQSGAAHNVSSPELANRVAEKFFESLGVHSPSADAVRERSLDEILDAQSKTSLELGLPLGVLPWQPSLDGDILPRQPLAALRAGAARDVRLMAGTNLDEWRLFMFADPKGRRLDDVGLRRRLERAVPGEDEHGEPWASRVERDYSSSPARRASWTPVDRWVAIQSDRVFHYPVHALIEAQVGGGGAAYSYLFDWTPPLIGGWVGSFHGLEIPFVFGTLRDGPMRQLLGRIASVRTLSERMQEAWIGFAATGNPSHAGLPAWNPVDLERPATMVFGERCELHPMPHDSKPTLWGEILRVEDVPGVQVARPSSGRR